MKSHPKTRIRRGFTLVELLVSMGITSVLMITLLSLVATSTDNYISAQKSINALSQARSFMLFFSREISSQLPSTLFLHEKTDTYTGPESSDKFLFTRVLTADEQTDTDPGDLGTSFYYVAFSTDSGSAVSPKLFRRSIGSEDTQGIIDSGTSATIPSADIASDEPIIYNILRFISQPKYIDSSGDLQDWEMQSASLPSPSLLELEITFLDDSSAEGLISESQWTAFSVDADARRLELEEGRELTNEDSRLESVRTFSRTLSLVR